jgi:hypothetical protein
MISKLLQLASLLIPAVSCFATQPGGYSSKVDLSSTDPNDTCCVCVYENDHRLQIGGNYSYCWLKPDGNPTLHGNLGGAQGIYEYRPIEAGYGALAFNYRIGKVSHDSSSRKLQDFNPQARFGYTFGDYCYLDRLTFFTGFGARYMTEKASSGSASIEFDYTTFYVPVGFLWEQEVVDSFSIGINFQWLAQVLPMVRIKPLNNAQWDLSYQLLNFFVEVPFIFSSCDETFMLSINPFFECWRDGHTKATTLTGLALGLPGNKYLFTGVYVNFGFSF